MAKGELILSKVTIMHLVVKFLVSIHASWKWWNLFICTIFIKTRLFCIFCIILSCHIFHYCCKSPYFTYHYSQKYKIKLSFSSNYPAPHAAFYKCYAAFSQCACNITQLYNYQINVRALIGQSGVGYCAGKPTEKSCVYWIII